MKVDSPTENALPLIVVVPMMTAVWVRYVIASALGATIKKEIARMLMAIRASISKVFLNNENADGIRF